MAVAYTVQVKTSGVRFVTFWRQEGHTTLGTLDIHSIYCIVHSNLLLILDNANLAEDLHCRRHTFCICSKIANQASAPWWPQLADFVP